MKTKAWKNRISFFTHENNHKNVTFRRFDQDDPWWSRKRFFFKVLNFINHSECSANANGVVRDLKCHRKIRNSLETQLLSPSCNFWMFPREKLRLHISATSELRPVADSVLFFLCFHGGVAPDDGYDNLIWEDTEIWTSRKEDVNPSVNPYTI